MASKISLGRSAMLAGTVFAATLVLAAAGGFRLLSQEEYQSELAARAKPGASFATRAADLNAPTITVVKPDRSGPIQPPVDIDVRFQAAEGATVSLPSLRIRYGFLGIDVTQRILGAPGVQVSPAGLRASGAQLPSGSHKLIIEIADNYGRTGRQTLEFTVK
jgi:hypothetical protein